MVVTDSKLYGSLYARTETLQQVFSDTGTDRHQRGDAWCNG